MSGHEYVELLRRAGAPDWLANDFFLIYGQGPIFAGGAAHTDDLVERLTGRPARTFERWAREHAATFAPA
jgi:hypothetical protein